MAFPNGAGLATAATVNEARKVVGTGKCDETSSKPSLPNLQVDPRAVFLLRAAARYELVAAGAMDIEEAVCGLFDASFMLFPCDCEIEGAAA
jgi:hypothetical protein